MCSLWWKHVLCPHSVHLQVRFTRFPCLCLKNRNWKRLRRNLRLFRVRWLMVLRRCPRRNVCNPSCWLDSSHDTLLKTLNGEINTLSFLTTIYILYDSFYHLIALQPYLTVYKWKPSVLISSNSFKGRWWVVQVEIIVHVLHDCLGNLNWGVVCVELGHEVVNWEWRLLGLFILLSLFTFFLSHFLGLVVLPFLNELLL